MPRRKCQTIAPKRLSFSGPDLYFHRQRRFPLQEVIPREGFLQRKLERGWEGQGEGEGGLDTHHPCPRYQRPLQVATSKATKDSLTLHLQLCGLARVLLTSLSVKGGHILFSGHGASRRCACHCK